MFPILWVSVQRHLRYLQSPIPSPTWSFSRAAFLAHTSYWVWRVWSVSKAFSGCIACSMISWHIWCVQPRNWKDGAAGSELFQRLGRPLILFVYFDMMLRIVMWPIDAACFSLSCLFATAALWMLRRFSQEDWCLQRLQTRAATALACSSCCYLIVSITGCPIDVGVSFLKLADMVPSSLMITNIAYLAGASATANFVISSMALIAFSSLAAAAAAMLASFAFAFVCWICSLGCVIIFCKLGYFTGITTHARRVAEDNAHQVLKALDLFVFTWWSAIVIQACGLFGLLSTTSQLRISCVLDLLSKIGASQLTSKKKNLIRAADLYFEFPRPRDSTVYEGSTLVLTLRVEVQDGVEAIACNTMSGEDQATVTLTDPSRQTVENFRMHLCEQLGRDPRSLKLVLPCGTLLDEAYSLRPVLAVCRQGATAAQ
mmetsp:Transcript_151867/g.268162  ORF Transcript_151867/g.268162 Transcript_151867/m.268162 type:complete len:429 (+) Transcript_151867:78-1364(+)